MLQCSLRRSRTAKQNLNLLNMNGRIWYIHRIFLSKIGISRVGIGCPFCHCFKSSKFFFFFNLEISNINTYNANWQLVFIYVHVQKKKSYLKVICFLTLSSALVALPVGDDANVRMWTRSLKFGKWFKKHLGVEYNIRLVCRWCGLLWYCWLHLLLYTWVSIL